MTELEPRCRKRRSSLSASGILPVMQAHPAVESSTTGKQITLFIPGLFAGPNVPASLQRLLTRADHLPGGADGATQRLFALFNIATETGHDLPVAAVTRVADMGVVDREWWVRADPVHLAPSRDGLVLSDDLNLSQAEAHQLVTELGEALAVDGWLLKAPRPQRWYLKPPAEPRIVTTPLSAVVGRDVHTYLPKGPDGKAWHTHLNEIQILLHTSPVNDARETRGLLPANSVWFWGGGRLPQAGAVRWAHVWSNEPLSQGMARLSGVSSRPVPLNAAELLGVSTDGEQLFVLELSTQTDTDALQALADNWLSPLCAAVHAGVLDSLELISDSGPLFHYRKQHRWRFWRRQYSFATWRVAQALRQSSGQA